MGRSDVPDIQHCKEARHRPQHTRLGTRVNSRDIDRKGRGRGDTDAGVLGQGETIPGANLSGIADIGPAITTTMSYLRTGYTDRSIF